MDLRKWQRSVMTGLLSTKVSRRVLVFSARFRTGPTYPKPRNRAAFCVGAQGWPAGTEGALAVGAQRPRASRFPADRARPLAHGCPPCRGTEIARASTHPQESMHKLELISDCSACAGLCCIAHPFDRSEDFPFDKGAGERCRHLTQRNRCTIHTRRAELGCTGCIQYECYGAGQHATQRMSGAHGPDRNRVFLSLRDLHECTSMLLRAADLCPEDEQPVRRRVADLADEIEHLARGSVETLARLETTKVRTRTQVALREVGYAIERQNRRRAEG